MVTTYCDYYQGHSGYQAYHGCETSPMVTTYCDYYQGHSGYQAYHGCETSVIEPLTPNQVAAGVTFIGANGVAMVGTLAVCMQDAITEILDILRKTPHEGSGYHKIVNGLNKPIHIRIDPPDEK